MPARPKHSTLIEVVAKRAFRDSRGMEITPGKMAKLHPMAATAAIARGDAAYPTKADAPESTAAQGPKASKAKPEPEAPTGHATSNLSGMADKREK